MAAPLLLALPAQAALPSFGKSPEAREKAYVLVILAANEGATAAAHSSWLCTGRRSAKLA